VFGELGADAGDAFVPDDLIKPELLSLGALVLDGLFAGADAIPPGGSADYDFAAFQAGNVRLKVRLRCVIISNRVQCL
jgi:hypothetical protein